MADSSRVWCTLEKTANNPGSTATRAGAGMKLESWAEGLHGDPKKMMASRGKALPHEVLALSYKKSKAVFLPRFLPISQACLFA